MLAKPIHLKSGQKNKIKNPPNLGLNLRKEIVRAVQPHDYLLPVAVISSKDKVYPTKRQEYEQCLTVPGKKKISKLHRSRKTVPYMSLKKNCDVENTAQGNTAVSQ